MKHDDLYMRIARVIAAQSHCQRLQVGAVIVVDDNIVSFGWNGTLPGLPNTCEDGGTTLPTVMHAEQNALAKAARSSSSVKGGTIYLTHSPCWTCALNMVQSGIERVVFESLYRDSDPVILLHNRGITVEKFG